MDGLLCRLPIPIRALFTPDMLKRALELRFRIGVQAELRTSAGIELIGQPITPDAFRELIAMLTGHSIYALEDRFDEGFFQIGAGYRVGITGGYNGGSLQHPSSISIRVSREIIGAADALVPHIIGSDGLIMSTLILSKPMLGKTTMLRDAARKLSLMSYHVAISDERSELAGCHMGVPTLDVGPLTDVCDGLKKSLAIPRLVRSMAPDVIITDELGDSGDSEAVTDAARSGVAVIASAHADSYESAARRRILSELMRDWLFRRVVLLGSEPGKIVAIYDGEGHSLI